VARAYNSAHQTLILEEAGPIIEENNIKLIVGIQNDSQFGPIIMVGMGGIMTEVMKDVAKLTETFTNLLTKIQTIAEKVQNNNGTIIFVGAVDEEGNATGIKNLVKKEMNVD
ncbi:DNA repair protein, partial [Marine Group I thaumarchaeote SCGC AAA799-D11]